MDKDKPPPNREKQKKEKKCYHSENRYQMQTKQQAKRKTNTQATNYLNVVQKMFAFQKKSVYLFFFFLWYDMIVMCKNKKCAHNIEEYQ